MINTKIKLITVFVARDGETVYSQHKQDPELTMAQIISFSQQDSDFKKINKIGKKLRPARYDLNQIQY